MKKALSFKTLESRIYLVITLMLFTAIFIMQLVFFRFVSTTVTSSTLDNNRTLLRQLVIQIDSYLSGIEKVSEVIVNDKDIQFYLENLDDDNLQYSIEQQLYNYTQARTDISNILIYAKDGSVILSDPELKINPWAPIQETGWYKNAINQRGRIAVSESYVQNIIVGQYTWVVSLSREIFSKVSGKYLGVLLVDLKFNRIDELCRSLVIGEKGYDFIVDNSGNYIFHPTQQLINSNLRSEPIKQLVSSAYRSEKEYVFNDDKYYMTEKSGITNWNVVSVTHKSDIVTDWQNVQLIYTLVGFFLFLIVGPITKRVSSGISGPIKKLQRIMKTVENGEFNLIGELEATEEIQNLAYDYNVMVGRIKELVATNNRDQELKRKSDLVALQAQINPHFLYNTLDSIIWMGEMGQHKEVVLMTSALSKLFRISISKGHEIITIRDEIAHIQSYLTIQGMRYQDKFSYLIDIDPDLHIYPIIKITLQPLVENAIYHGIKEKEGKGFIKITGRQVHDVIFIDVEDNGLGMTEEVLEELRSGVEIKQTDFIEESKHGMGLRNVHQRIRLYFGEDYGLTFNSVLGEGSTLTIALPAKMMEKKA